MSAHAAAGPYAIVDAEGRLLHGDAALVGGMAVEMTLRGERFGSVFGRDAAQLARLLELLAEQAWEARAIAADSLEKYKELTMLYNVSEKLYSAVEVEQIGELIRDEVKRLVRCDGVSVLLINDETRRLEIISAEGDNFDGRSSLSIEDDLIGAVLSSGKGEIVNEAGGPDRPIASKHGFASVICSPLKARNRVFGVVVVGTAQPHEYTAGDLQIVNALTSQAATALEVARLNKVLVAKEQKPTEVTYGVGERPPLVSTGVLAFQHLLIALMSLAYPILVTLEAGGDRLQAASVASYSLIAMAIATFLQSCAGPPIGSGFLMPHITSAVFLSPSLIAARTGGLGLVFGMTLFAGLCGIFFSQVISRFRKIFPPEVSGVVVLMVGLSMIRVALSRFLGLGDGDEVSDLSEIAVGLVTIVTIIALTVSSYPQLRLYSTLIGLLAGFALSLASGIISGAQLAGIADLPMFGLPSRPTLNLQFDLLLVIPFFAAAMAGAIKNAGLVTSIQKTSDRNWKRPETGSIGGGIMADGLGNISAGLLGGVGLGIGAGNVGLSIATGALSRVIGVATGFLFLALAVMPQLMAAFALMPSPVIGAGLIYVACYLVTSGTQLIVSRMLDARRTFVIGLAIIGGVGVEIVPDAFAGAPVWAQAFVSSSLAMSTTLAVGLNMILSFGVSTTARRRVSLLSPLREPITRFVEGNGAAWGARGDVIGRAVPALIELCEEVRQSSGFTEVDIEMRFDEFHLSILMMWEASDKDVGSGLNATALVALKRHVQQRYDCKVTLSSDETSNTVRLDFIH
ncbi:solute carrier family 23 protein [Aurantimonas sp. A2-1-M11]|uniref:solute carrier family 23 protein n=1 Tax=Aurantimonas sp. A2-1-M11 TaxID=3113712 RepID=UPI002F94CB49